MYLYFVFIWRSFPIFRQDFVKILYGTPSAFSLLWSFLKKFLLSYLHLQLWGSLFLLFLALGSSFYCFVKSLDELLFMTIKRNLVSIIAFFTLQSSCMYKILIIYTCVFDVWKRSIVIHFFFSVTKFCFNRWHCTELTCHDQCLVF